MRLEASLCAARPVPAASCFRAASAAASSACSDAPSRSFRRAIDSTRPSSSAAPLQQCQASGRMREMCSHACMARSVPAMLHGLERAKPAALNLETKRHRQQQQFRAGCSQAGVPGGGLQQQQAVAHAGRPGGSARGRINLRQQRRRWLHVAVAQLRPHLPVSTCPLAFC